MRCRKPIEASKRPQMIQPGAFTPSERKMAIAYHSRQALAGSSDRAVGELGEDPVGVLPVAAVASDEGVEVVAVGIALGAEALDPDLLGHLDRP